MRRTNLSKNGAKRRPTSGVLGLQHITIVTFSVQLLLSLFLFKRVRFRKSGAIKAAFLCKRPLLSLVKWKAFAAAAAADDDDDDDAVMTVLQARMHTVHFQIRHAFISHTRKQQDDVTLYQAHLTRCIDGWWLARIVPFYFIFLAFLKINYNKITFKRTWSLSNAVCFKYVKYLTTNTAKVGHVTPSLPPLT